jgi:hypothetical protein
MVDILYAALPCNGWLYFPITTLDHNEPVQQPIVTRSNAAT